MKDISDVVSLVVSDIPNLEHIPDDIALSLILFGPIYTQIQRYEDWYLLIFPDTGMNSFFDMIDEMKAIGFKVLGASYDAAGLLGGHQIEFYQE